MATTRKHFVTFLSPGTMFDETTQKAIGSWDPKKAAKMAADIKERYGARPYGFQFSTAICSDPVDDGEGGKLTVAPKTVEKSGTYYIDGTLRTAEGVARDAIKEESILLSNMRGNGWWIVCETTNSYRHTGIFEEKDFVASKDGEITERGTDPRHVAYRAEMKAKQAA